MGTKYEQADSRKSLEQPALLPPQMIAPANAFIPRQLKKAIRAEKNQQEREKIGSPLKHFEKFKSNPDAAENFHNSQAHITPNKNANEEVIDVEEISVPVHAAGVQSQNLNVKDPDPLMEGKENTPKGFATLLETLQSFNFLQPGGPAEDLQDQVTKSPSQSSPDIITMIRQPPLDYNIDPQDDLAIKQLIKHEVCQDLLFFFLFNKLTVFLTLRDYRRKFLNQCIHSWFQNQQLPKFTANFRKLQLFYQFVFFYCVFIFL